MHAGLTAKETRRKKYTEKNRRDKLIWKEQAREMYGESDTEQKMERYIQKIHNMERDLQSMRQGKGEMEGRGKWKLGVGGQLQMVRGGGRS